MCVLKVYKSTIVTKLYWLHYTREDSQIYCYREWDKQNKAYNWRNYEGTFLLLTASNTKRYIFGIMEIGVGLNYSSKKTPSFCKIDRIV